MRLISKAALGGAAFFLSQFSFAVSCDNLSTWTSALAYKGADQVQHMGSAYEAKWWTQNDNPSTSSGQWDVWKSLGICDGGGGENMPPNVNINGPYSGMPGNNISFSRAGSADADGAIAAYLWSFGDGQTSSDANPQYAYATSGSYSVTLQITDNEGASASATTAVIVGTISGGVCEGLPSYSAGTPYNSGDRVVNILTGSGVSAQYECDIAGWCSSAAAWAYEPGNGAHWDDAWNFIGECSSDGNMSPQANANGPYSGLRDSYISFSSAGSSDPDGTIVSYLWDFGDGNSSTVADPVYAYTAVGSYAVSLTVTDDDGASAVSTTTATITADGNQAPTANANGPYAGAPGSSIRFSSAGSSDSDGSITEYLWSFGDGASSTDANPTHSYSAAGSYDVQLTVKDDDGASSVASTRANISSGPSGDKKVIGYFAQWGVYGRNYHVKNIVTSGSAEKLTHIMYAFGNVTNGRCQIGDSYADYDRFYDADLSVDGEPDSWDTGALRGSFNQLRKLKEMYPNIKVVWSFGGWTWSGGFGQAAANPEAFANSCYDLLHDPRWDGVFDGIDIDWEYPNSCGLSCDTSGFDAYGNLMRALRNRFGSELVTSAIGAGEAKINAANFGEASQHVDFYMVMTYDFFGAFAPQGPTAPHSALFNFPSIPTSGFYSENAIDVLKSKGVPSEKLLLGIGFYGRGWTGVTQSAPGGSASGAAPGSYEPGIEDYKVLKNTCPATGTIAGTAYAHCGNNWWSYDTPATIDGKMDWANSQGLGGAFFWELSGDTSDGELIKAINDGL